MVSDVDEEETKWLNLLWCTNCEQFGLDDMCTMIKGKSDMYGEERLRSVVRNRFCENMELKNMLHVVGSKIMQYILMIMQ